MAWLFLLVLFLPFSAFAPAVALLPLLLLPDGDGWGLVSIRVGAVAAFIAGYRAWIGASVRFARRAFAGRLPAAFDDWLRRDEPEPKGMIRALGANAHLAVFAALGVALMLGLEPPPPVLGGTSRRFRGVVAVLGWCRGHPRTTTASAFIVTARSVLVLGYRVLAARRPAEGRIQAASEP